MRSTFLRSSGTGCGQPQLLGEALLIGKRLQFQYVNATLYTDGQLVRVYHTGRLVKPLRSKIRKA